MAFTPAQIKELQQRSSQGAVGGSLTPSQIRQLQSRATTAPTQSGELFSGGTFSDVLDILQLPQFVATGALTPGLSVSEAVKQRVTPGQALDIQSGAGRFLTDVLADPLNIVGVGALTKGGKAAQLAGKGARTLGGAARAGERALLSVAGAPVIRGQKVLEGITKATTRLKDVPGIGRISEALGGVGALPAARTIPEIEKAVGGIKSIKDLKLAAKGVEGTAIERIVSEAMNLRQAADKLIDAKKITRNQYQDMVEKLANPGAKIKIADEAEQLFQTFKKQFDDLGAEFTRITGNALEGKVVKNLLTPAAKEAVSGVKPFKGAVREIAGSVGSEQFASKVGFKSLGKKAEPVFGDMAGKTAAKLADGTNLTRVGNTDVYASSKMQSLINVIKAQTKDADELAEGIKKLQKNNPNEFFTRVAMSPRQINEAMKAAGKALRFSEDPASIFAAQAGDVAKLQTRERFVNGIKEGVEAGKFGQRLPKGADVPEGFSRSTIKGLEDYVFSDELVGHLDKTFKSFSNIEDVNDFIKMYDKVLNFWKGTATFINPSFHSRNAVSNHWQLYLADVNNPIDHLRGYNIGRKISKAIKVGDDPIKAVPKKYRGYVDEFLNDQGLRSTGAFSTDIDKPTFKLQDNLIFDKAGAAGEFLENGAKLSLYINKRMKGFTPEAAGREVRKYLFDYSDLTDFERNVLKRFMPFYTWTRNNLPLQVAMLIQKPTKVSVIAKAKNAIEASQGKEGMKEQYIPEWLREAYPIYIGTGKNGLQRFIKLEGFLPTVDLNKLTRIPEMPFEQMSPIIKTPMELMSNYDFFFEKQIQDFEGQKKFRGLVPGTDIGVNVPVKIDKVLDMIRPLSELEKFTIDPTKDVQPTGAQQLINFLFGKTYQLDPRRQKEVFEFVQGKALGGVKKDLERARERRDREEINRLKDLIKAIESGEGVQL